MVILLYVDDLLLAANNMEAIIWMKRELDQRFEMKDPGDAGTTVGLETARDSRKLTVLLSQPRFVK